MGGTFDPVHVGHLVAANTARYALGLDVVMLVVAGDPWQKHDAVVAPAEARYEMVAAACDGVEGLAASRIELDRPGLTYTIDTVEELRHPGREIVVIVGADVARTMHTWHRVDELRGLVSLAVVDREHAAPPSLPAGWRAQPVAMPGLDVSSSDLRRRIAAGQPVDFLIPAPAVRVLRAHNLYTSG
jgi:nicotinate-nucleotide adenylyltransferase